MTVTRWTSPVFLFFWGIALGIVYTSEWPAIFLAAFSVVNCILVAWVVGRLWWRQFRLIKWIDSIPSAPDPEEAATHKKIPVEGKSRRHNSMRKQRAAFNRRNGRTMESISGSTHTLLHTNNCRLKKELAKNLSSQLN
jgi:hypothetical protein